MDISSLLQTLISTGGSPFLVGALFMLLFTLAPGPINAVVVKHTIENGVMAGGRIAIGNCLGDMTSIFLASLPFLFGITFLVDWLQANFNIAMAVMAVVLLIFGGHMIYGSSIKKNTIKQAQPEKKLKHTVLAYIYTSLHPGSLLTATALVTTLQANHMLSSRNDVAMLIMGVAVGAIGGWGFYLTLLGRARQKVTTAWLDRIRAGVGIFIVGLALFIGLRLIISM